jgi:hypothetical protein
VERLEIRDFRVLTEPVCLGPFDARLTVIAGDNEDGKSTVLDALRTVLFEKHRITGAGAERMRPWDRDVAPEIVLEFTQGAARWRIEKRFCRRPMARLRCLDDARSWDDDAAEDMLEALLGFSRPARGASDRSHQGVWGLLWVEQGATHEPLRPAAGARATIGAALEQEVGAVLGGTLGRRLADRIAARHRTFWTDTGRPGGEYGRLLREAEALRGEIDTAATRLARWDEELEQLERLDARLRGLEAEQVIDRLRAAEQAAREAVEGLAELERALEAARAAARVAVLERDRALDGWSSRRALIERRAEALGELEQTLARRDAAAQALGECEREAEQRRIERDQASEAFRGARDRQRRLDQGLEQGRLRDEAEALALRIERAREDILALRRTRAALAADPATPERIEALERALRKRDALQARLAAGATRIRFHGDRVPSVSGRALADGASWLVTGAARFELPGLGIDVQVPEAELERVEIEKEDAERVLAAALTELGVEDRAAADRAEARRAKLARSLVEIEARAEALVPEGLEAVEERLEAVRARLTGFEEAARLETDEGADVPGAEARLARADAAWTVARERLASARARAEADRDATVRQEAALARLEGQLARERESLSDAELQERVTRSDAAAAVALRQEEAAAQALRDADAELLRLRLEDAGRAHAEARGEQARLRMEVERLRAALRASGRDGLAEAHADQLRAQLALERRLAVTARRAAAARLAHEALQAAAGAARERYLAPLFARLQPYLDRLLPGARLHFGDDMEVTGLERGGVAEPFEALSMGTREQLAVLVRLAFAELLSEQGEDAPVVLDDALVYADDRRFGTMQDVLRLASRKHQIIVLTCHERLWRGIGGPVLRVESAPTGAA